MFEENVINIVRQAVADHPKPEDAQQAAEQKIRRLPHFRDLLQELVKTAVLDLVHRERGSVNRALRNQAGEYGRPAKVVVGASEAVSRAYQSYYNYFVGGSMLGMIKGEQLLELAGQERALAAGHVFNARLLEELNRLVPADREVRQAVSERKLKGLFERLKQETQPPQDGNGGQ
jgi:hypothetical protein